MRNRYTPTALHRKVKEQVCCVSLYTHVRKAAWPAVCKPAIPFAQIPGINKSRHPATAAMQGASAKAIIRPPYIPEWKKIVVFPPIPFAEYFLLWQMKLQLLRPAAHLTKNLLLPKNTF